MAMSTLDEAVAAIGRLGMAVVVDDADGCGSSGYLVMASEAATPDALAFFREHAADVVTRTDHTSTDHTSTDHTSTDHTRTDHTRTDHTRTDHTRTDRVARAGGRPLPAGSARDGAGRAAAASVDLVRAAGLGPSAVLGAILRVDRTGAARLDEIEAFADRFGLPIVPVSAVARRRQRGPRHVRRVSGARIPTEGGDWRAVVYESLPDGEQHLALVKGEVGPDMLVRVHSECLTGDVFGSLRCDCGPQLRAAIDRIDREGRGVVVYLRGHEGRGIGLGHKIDTYRLQEQGHDTVDANVALGLPVDSREYGVGARMLVDLGVTTLRLMTNNPAKYAGLEGFGLDIAERIPLEASPNPENLAYLRTKRERMGHLLDHLDGAM